MLLHKAGMSFGSDNYRKRSSNHGQSKGHINCLPLGAKVKHKSC